MEQEQPRKEYSAEELAVAKELEKKFENVLGMVGLQTPIDYIFLDFALQKSRQNLATVSDSLHFLFHTVSQHDLDHAERPFPFSIFMEKYKTRVFKETEAETEEEEELVMWSLVPSEKYKTRTVLPFTDFHLYFQDIIRPLYGYSAEDLYRLLDQKKGQLFFVTHGTRSSTESKRIVTLFVTGKNIIAFHFDPVDVTKTKKEEKFMSKWISLNLPVSLQSLEEYAIFEMPNHNLVMTEDEVKESERMEESKETQTPTKMDDDRLPEIGKKGKVVFSQFNFGTEGLDSVDVDECLGCGS